MPHDNISHTTNGAGGGLLSTVVGIDFLFTYGDGTTKQGAFTRHACTMYETICKLILGLCSIGTNAMAAARTDHDAQLLCSQSFSVYLLIFFRSSKASVPLLTYRGLLTTMQI